MASYFFAQAQAPPLDQALGEILQGVLPAIILILLIAGALVLVVLLLRFAAKVNALPQSVKSSDSSAPFSTSEAQDDQRGQGNQKDDASGNRPFSATGAHIEISAQNYQSVSVRWTIPTELTQSLQTDRGNALMIRLLDVTQIDLANQLPHAIYDYPCDWVNDVTPQVMGIAVVQGDRDYIAELGYMTADRQWHQLARSGHVRVSTTVSSS